MFNYRHWSIFATLLILSGSICLYHMDKSLSYVAVGSMLIANGTILLIACLIEYINDINLQSNRAMNRKIKQKDA